MSQAEPTLLEPPTERPHLDLHGAAETRPRDLLIRFVAGAITSIIAAVLTLAFGPRVGGVMLAFPAILVASLTLIAEQDDRQDARHDARGAVLGGIALAGFALAGWILFGSLPGGVALALAALAWLGVALGLYAVLWWR
jgi:uncharacterized membrane protein (GlpM family)